jgi:hypothetical protein
MSETELRIARATRMTSRMLNTAIANRDGMVGMMMSATGILSTTSQSSMIEMLTEWITTNPWEMRNVVIEDEHIKERSTKPSTQQVIGIGSGNLGQEMDSTAVDQEMNGQQNPISNATTEIETWVLNLVKSIGIDHTTTVEVPTPNINHGTHPVHQHIFSTHKTIWQ